MTENAIIIIICPLLQLECGWLAVGLLVSITTLEFGIWRVDSVDAPEHLH